MVKKSVLFVSKSAPSVSQGADVTFKHLIRKIGQEDKWTVECASLFPTLPLDVRLAGSWYRLLCLKDFEEFDFILAVEQPDLDELLSMAPPNSKAKIKLIGDFHPSGQLVFADALKVFTHQDDYSFAFKLSVKLLPCIINFLDQNS